MTVAPELIVAIADNMAIGKNGDIPWHLSEDLRHFKAVTMGHPVIMGRRTFESIGRALPGRLNIIVSKTLKEEDPSFQGDNIKIVTSLTQALTLKVETSPMIIGGARLYAEALPLCAVLHLTRVHLSPDGADTFFPTIPQSEFEKISRESHKDGVISYDFEIWKRIF